MRKSSTGSAQVAGQQSVGDAKMARAFMAPTISSASKQSSRQSRTCTSTIATTIPDFGRRRSRSAGPKLQSPAKGFMVPTISSASKQSSRCAGQKLQPPAAKSLNAPTISSSSKSTPSTISLSPRPRFHSYKPNPSHEILLKKEKEMDSDVLKTLEDDDEGDDIYMKDTEWDKLEDREMVTRFEEDEVSEKKKLENLASVERSYFSEHDINVSGDSNQDIMEVIASAKDMVSMPKVATIDSSTTIRPSLYESTMITGRRRKNDLFPVYLNVYDLTPMNNYAYGLGLGVYHSGVQVHGDEYSFGLNEDSTGIFRVKPERCPGFRFRKSILIGGTDLSLREVRSLMKELEWEYWGNTYNLVSKNCNHFSNYVCIRLTGKSIPRWVNRLARLGNHLRCVSG